MSAITVSDYEDLQTMGGYLLSGDRKQPAIALTSGSTGRLVLAPDRVRTIVGGARIYLVTGKDVLLHLEGLLGANLALPVRAARIWWPELTFDSDPLEHPVIFQLEDESESDMLAEFVRCFELTRPAVRREIQLIEDTRVLLESELAQAREQQRRTDERLRETQVEVHEQAMRAEETEARLASTTRELERLRSSIGEWPEKGTGSG